jgi:hypothetical protein
MKLDTDPFPASMVNLEEKRILVCSNQANTTHWKNVIVSDELRLRIIVPRSPEVGTWKENIARKTTWRVKPTSTMLIEKYLRQLQDGVYIGQRKRPRSLGYRYGPINPASRGRVQLHYLEYARPHGGAHWREEMGTRSIDRPAALR